MGGLGLLLVSPIVRTGKKLIEQAVGAARGQPPPADLQLAWKCQQWGALPDAGGMNDQDYKRLQGMSVSLNIYNTISYMKNLKGSDIHRLSDSQRRMIRWLLDQGISVLNG